MIALQRLFSLVFNDKDYNNYAGLKLVTNNLKKIKKNIFVRLIYRFCPQHHNFSSIGHLRKQEIFNNSLLCNKELGYIYQSDCYFARSFSSVQLVLYRCYNPNILQARVQPMLFFCDNVGLRTVKLRWPFGRIYF